MTLCIRLLGPVVVTLDGVPVSIASKRARALLGYLALREGVEVSRSLLTGLFWGERSESQARASLRQTLSELRQALGEAASQSIASTKESLAFVAGSAWVDARVVKSAAGSSDDDALREASTLLGGELMEGLALAESGFEQWLHLEREQFRRLACDIHLRMMRRAEVDGKLEEALTSGLKLLALDPLQEQVHRALMRIYAAQGRYDAALAQYERCRRELASQLDVRPEAETDELARSIRTSRRGRQESTPNQPLQSVSIDRKRPVLPNRPSIAVLPFRLIGDDADSGYFAEGVADDIITELSRNRDLFVVARHSSFHVARQESDPVAIGQALGVRYLLLGSVRRAGDRLRLSVHLIECESGSETWAERYDRELMDLFEVQIDVARTVTSTISGRLATLAGEALAGKAPENLAAYDHVLRAQQFLQRYTREDYARAREHLSAAIRADPAYARPYGLMCTAGVYEWFWDMSNDGLDDVIRIGETALALDDQDVKTHSALAVANLFSWHHDRAVHHIGRAIALNPNDDLVIVEHARILNCLGRPEEGLLRVREAMRLNPYHPNWYWNIEGLSLHVCGLYEEAIAAYERVDMPQFWVEAYLAACYAMCGRNERAAYHRERLLAMHPRFNLTAFARSLPIISKPTVDRFMETFRRAELKD